MTDVRPDCVIQQELVEGFRESWQHLPRPHVLKSRRASDWTPNKNWPDPHWAELISRLSATSTVIETGWQRDTPTGAPAQNYIGLVGRTSLVELIAAIAAADIHVGPMSAPVHLAAAARKPSVVIARGYEHPQATLYPGNIAFYTGVPCAPCWLREPCPYGRPCLTMISPAAVESAVRDIWSELSEPER